MQMKFFSLSAYNISAYTVKYFILSHFAIVYQAGPVAVRKTAGFLPSFKEPRAARKDSLALCRIDYCNSFLKQRY